MRKILQKLVDSYTLPANSFANEKMLVIAWYDSLEIDYRVSEKLKNTEANNHTAEIIG